MLFLLREMVTHYGRNRTRTMSNTTEQNPYLPGAIQRLWALPERRVVWLDAFERVTMLILFGWFLFAVSKSIVSTWQAASQVVIGDIMLLITETAVIVFVLFRRQAKSLSLRLNDWFLAFSASCLPLFARPNHTVPHLWDTAAVPLTVLGLAMILCAKLTLGRRFGLVAANRGICDVGPYRLVRHPIYFGYLMLHVGFFMLNPTIWNFVVFAAFYAVLIPRIFAEERLLSQDEQYKSYMGRVRFRLVPGLF
jgi:protein-S-isoprenylcysteine O-methyltransferase Ste14